MLVLSRRSGEEVLVPQYGITLKILEIHGNQVRVGVSGPTEVQFYRGELWERMRRGPNSSEAVGVHETGICSPKLPS